MTLLRLREFEEGETALSDAQVVTLRDSFAHAIEIWPAGHGRYRVRARHFVGVIALEGLEIRINPKVHIGSLFYMLGYSHGLANLWKNVAGYEKSDQIWEFLLLLFARGTEELLQRGVRQGYIEDHDRLKALRGRFLFQEHIRRPPGRELLIPCRFEDFTADLPHNQVIRYTLEKIGWVRDPFLRHRLRRLRKEFSFAALRHFSPTDIGAFEYDRLSTHYEPIHVLCRILLECRGLDQPSGSYPLGTYLVDMNLLFERFIAAWFRENLPSPWSLRAQEPKHLDLGNRVRMRLDLCLEKHDEICLVADTKYKRTHDEVEDADDVITVLDGPASRVRVAPNDLYQVLAYCRALEIWSGVLLYPDWVGPPVRFRIRDDANEIVADGVDLGMPPEDVELAMGGLMRRLLSAGARAA